MEGGYVLPSMLDTYSLIGSLSPRGPSDWI